MSWPATWHASKFQNVTPERSKAWGTCYQKCVQNVLRTYLQNVTKKDNIKLHGRGWCLEHQSSHPTERCNNSFSMKLNLRPRGAQNAKPERSKRKRHVIKNTFRCTEETATERDSKRERMNLVLERRTPKRERRTLRTRSGATNIYMIVDIYCWHRNVW